MHERPRHQGFILGISSEFSKSYGVIRKNKCQTPSGVRGGSKRREQEPRARAMHSDRHFAPQSRRPFTPGGTVRRRSLFVGAWLLGSSVIAAWVVCLPLSTGTSKAGFESYSFAVRSTTSNSAVKGDRLDRVPMRTEIGSGPGHRRSQPPSPGVPASSSRRKLPVGCETAFGKLVPPQNFSARCVTSIDHTGKLAQSSTNIKHRRL